MNTLRAPQLSIPAPLLRILSLALTAGILVCDLMTPPGYAVSFLYIIPLLLLSQLSRPRLMYQAAAMFTLLLVTPLAAGRPHISWMVTNNKFVGIVGLWTAAYLLERKRKAEEALRESEERLRLAQNCANVGIWDWTLATGRLDWTPELERIYGYKPGAFPGDYAGFRDRVHPDDLAEVERLRDDAVKARLPFDSDFRVCLPSGEVRWINSKGSAIYDADGSPRRVFGVNADITERKRAEVLLRESENRFRISLETMLDGFAILSSIRDEAGRVVDFRYEYINEAGCRLNGRSREETLGRSFLEMFPTLEGSGLFEDYIRAAETGEPLAKEVSTYSISLPEWGPSSRVFEVRMARMGDGLAGTFKDVTKRRRMEDSLRDSEKRFRRLFDQSPLGVTLLSPDFRFLEVNKALSDITGYTPEELASRTVFHFVRREEEGAARVLAKRLLEGKTEQFEMEKSFTRKDASTACVRWNVRGISDGKGRILNLIAVVEDISEKKRMENALSSALQHINAHIENSPLAVIELDPEFRIVQWNRQAEHMFGWTAEEAIGRKAIGGMRWIHEEDLEAVQQGGADIASGRTPRILHVNRNYRKDGSVILCQWYISAIYDLGGRLASVLSQGLDITGQRRAEESLRSSLAQKDILLRELSHRTKNNMQVIVGLLGLQAARSKDAVLVNTLAEAQDRIRAMALVHERLYRSDDFSFLDLREYAKDLVASLLKAHQGSAGPVKAVLELEGIEVPLDAALSGGLILNELVSNSLKHAFPGRKGGTIFLSLRRSGEQVDFRYRDDGPGLPGGLDLSRIDSLGLKLVHNLAVRQLRGTLELVHRSGQTEFVFRFPMRTIKSDSGAPLVR